MVSPLAQGFSCARLPIPTLVFSLLPAAAAAAAVEAVAIAMMAPDSSVMLL